MRTLLVIVGGFVLWGLCIAIARAIGKGPAAATAATVVFAIIWLMIAAANMMVGLTHGYTVKEELPIFLLIFLLPVVVAAVVRWKLL